MGFKPNVNSAAESKSEKNKLTSVRQKSVKLLLTTVGKHFLL